VARIYVPTRGADDWRWLLAKPGLHWKQDASAKALADAWENAEDWPEPVAQSLATSPDLTGLELLLALPEHQTPLPGGNRASQSDLLVLARSPVGDLVAIAVEGKAQEPFGDTNVPNGVRAKVPGEPSGSDTCCRRSNFQTTTGSHRSATSCCTGRRRPSSKRVASAQATPSCWCTRSARPALSATMLGLRTSQRSPPSMA
jgi:hypothetical protein